MSWLYSLVFTGLLFASDGLQTPPAAVHSIPAAAPVDRIAVTDETEKFEQTYPLSRNGNVSVANVNGSITVEAWDRDEVRLEATKIADSRETLAEVEIVVDSTSDSLSVKADYKSWKWNDKRNDNRNRRLQVEFRLSVPRTAVLNEIETVNGSVTVSNFTNVTKISAVNGNVNAANLRGAANLSTVNGTVNADFDRVEPGSKISLVTVNGQVNLVLPSDVSATLKADTLNGNISNDFGLPVRKGQYVGRDLYGRLGGGEAQIKLNSVNGGLTVKRKSDGRSVSPATNLLPSKKADEEWDNDDNSRAARSDQVDREVSKAVSETKRTTARSMKDAKKALEAVGPVIEGIAADELAKLDKMKIDIDEQKIKKEINEALREQHDAMDRMNQLVLFQGAPTVEKKRNTFAVKGTPKVGIEAKGCSVTVRGWDKSEVHYVVTEVAGRRSRPTQITESHDTSSVTLKVVNTTTGASNFGFQLNPERVRIEVFVPRKANLKIVTDGEIRLDGVSGEIELKGEDEPINVRDVDGSLSLSSEEALVRVIGFTGDLSSQTACGDVFLEGDFKKLSAKAADGTVTLTVPTDANATFTSNTEIESDGVEIVRENGNTWRLGKGGAKYTFGLTDGRLVVRGAATISTY
jgi:DUF4097 and DUF4098 domain-containing protein YvlB